MAIHVSEAGKSSVVSKDFIRQMQGYGLTTAYILYKMPDHQTFLQRFIWQDYDVAPHFPVLEGFLAFWQRELDGPLHSITIAHSKLIKPAEFKAVNGIMMLH
jgi:uncharacterized protein Usg